MMKWNYPTPTDAGCNFFYEFSIGVDSNVNCNRIIKKTGIEPRIKRSLRRELNPRPADYKSAAIPLSH